MRLKPQTRQGIRRITGFAVALVIGAVLGVLGFWLPPRMQESPLERVGAADREIAATALRDAELSFFDVDLEQYLVTVTYVEFVSAGVPPEACPDGTTFHARVHARTIWWIPYDDVLWCGDEEGTGIFVTRQA